MGNEKLQSSPDRNIYDTKPDQRGSVWKMLTRIFILAAVLLVVYGAVKEMQGQGRFLKNIQNNDISSSTIVYQESPRKPTRKRQWKLKKKYQESSCKGNQYIGTILL